MAWKLAFHGSSSYLLILIFLPPTPSSAMFPEPWKGSYKCLVYGWSLDCHFFAAAYTAMSLCSHHTWVSKASLRGLRVTSPIFLLLLVTGVKAPWEVLFSSRMLNKTPCGWIIRAVEQWRVRREERLYGGQDPLCFLFPLGCSWTWESQWGKIQRVCKDQLRFIHEA